MKKWLFFSHRAFLLVIGLVFIPCPISKGSSSAPTISVYNAFTSINGGNLQSLKNSTQSYQNIFLWTNSDGSTLLHKAIEKGNGAMVTYLLERDPQGRFLTMRNRAGQTPLELAQRLNNRDLVQRLQQVKNNDALLLYSSGASSATHSTSSQPQQKTTQPLSPKGNALIPSARNSLPAKSSSSQTSQTPPVSRSWGTDTSSPTVHQQTPQERLHSTINSVKEGNLREVKEFVQDFPRFWEITTTHEHSTLLHKAARYNALEIVEYLLEKDPELHSLDIKNDYNQTPLDVAQLSPDRKLIVDRLHEAIEIKQALEASKNTAPTLSQAQSSTSSTISPAAPATTTQDDQIHFYRAINALNNKDFSTFSNLLSQDPSMVTKKDSDGRTLLFVAAENGDIRALNLLIDIQGTDINALNRAHVTPLAKAISKSAQASGDQKADYKNVITTLMKRGGTVFAQVYLLLEADPQYEEELTSLVKSALLPNNSKVTELDSIPHISFAYLSLPITYMTHEGREYRDEGKNIKVTVENLISLEGINENLSTIMNRSPLTPEIFIKPAGSFLAVYYDAPPSYSKLLSSFYARALAMLPGAERMYSQELPPHVSIAKVRKGTSKSSLAAIALPEVTNIPARFKNKLKVSVRIPSSKDTKGYEEIG